MDHGNTALFKADGILRYSFIARDSMPLGGIPLAEIGRIRKNETTEIVVQKTEYRGSTGIDIREYVTSERYTGWSKNGIRIPVERWKEFKEKLDRVDGAP
jgi:hypothetical protein